MKPAVYIRSLVLDDAKTSYVWRNDADIWEYTGFKPNKYISVEIEEEWLKSKLVNINEKRFAICLEENDQYIGNIQLLDIDAEKAWYHIFIGEKDFWRKGISQKATNLLLSHAFSELDLKHILLEVNPLNIAAYNVYKKTGFVPIGTNKQNGFIKMMVSKSEFYNKS